MSTTEAGIVSAAVVSLTQLMKWTGLIPDRYGPGSVLVWAALGVLLWAWSGDRLHQAVAFDLFSGWVVVALASAGIYGFTRAAASSLTRATPPPDDGAGMAPTDRDEMTEAVIRHRAEQMRRDWPDALKREAQDV